MKTREQAEARALELFPKVPIHSQHYVTNQISRQSFLQCWEEMQQNKQTCGFCVDVNTESAINMGRTLRLSDYNPIGQSDQHEDYRNGVRDVVKYLLNAQPTDNEEVIDNYTDSIVSNNKLREAAEEAVSAFCSHSLCGELLKQAVLKIEKALK